MELEPVPGAIYTDNKTNVWPIETISTPAIIVIQTRDQ